MMQFGECLIDLLGDRLHDPEVDVEQVVAAHAGLARHAGRNHHDVGVGGLRVVRAADDATVRPGRSDTTPACRARCLRLSGRRCRRRRHRPVPCRRSHGPRSTPTLPAPPTTVTLRFIDTPPNGCWGSWVPWVLRCYECLGATSASVPRVLRCLVLALGCHSATGAWMLRPTHPPEHPSTRAPEHPSTQAPKHQAPYMLLIISSPNSDVFNSVAPDIKRAKS